MKNRLFILLVSFLATAWLFNGCTPEEYEMGEVISKSQLNFSITPDANDPNKIILESLTPGVTPLWITPLGRSTKVVDSVKIAFPGEYNFVYGVQSSGGFVQADTVTVNITTTNLDYVNDKLWEYLTGGVGEEKTWYLDLDAEATSKYFAGPLYFAGLSWGWGNECVDEVDCWSWEPDWAGNSWLMPAGDYGSMTFSLKGNALVTVDHKMLGRVENGTYFLDADTKTLKMTDAGPLHDAGRDGHVIDWGDLRVISLTENTMQLAALRDEALSGEGPVWLIYNYISKEYSESWVPEDQGDPEIDVDLGGGSASDLISVSTSKTWTLSIESPFNYASLEGELLNSWESVDDYPDWAGYGVEDQVSVSNCKIQFVNDGSVVITNNDGVESEGTYSVEEGTNVITFDGVTPNFQMGDWAVATTTAQNQWKIVKTGKTGDIVTDIWFGKRDEVKPEYMVYHFKLGSSDVDPAEIARKQIIDAICGPTGTRSFRVSDTWHVDWLNADYEGGWTSETTFGDDFTSNSWVWTEAVKAGLQDPRLTFTLDAGTVTCTRTQNGETTSVEVIIDGENSTLTIDMDLIAFEDAASWLPTYGPTWKICKNPTSAIETDGMWLGVPTPGNAEEVTAIHYVIAE